MIEINPVGATIGLLFLTVVLIFAWCVIYHDWKLHHPKKKTTTKQLHKT
jgi:hypothetical protein